MTIDNAHNKVPVIQKIDKDFPEWLDFTALRNEGLKHLGALSGKLWTDHNLHDPGITTLEVLSYAILDLGYRTSRPIDGLLAPTTDNLKDDNFKDDNFFTPNQILTNNPLTIMDYRKLLLSLPEIRNAWLIVSDASKVMVLEGGKDSKDLTINGLYKILIEPNFDWVKDNASEETDIKLDPSVIRPKISHQDLSRKVTKLLNKHRNLCEDFEPFEAEKSAVLSADPLVIKGTVLLENQADAARVYADIHRAVAAFIAPSARFYALQELLDKGKTIEDIYEGRPSMTVNFPTLQSVLQTIFQTAKADFDGKTDAEKRIILSKALLNSAVFSDFNTGFIDADELHNSKPRKEIHISDLYNLVSQVEGVQSVQLLQLVGQQGRPKNWCYTVADNAVPVLQDLELTLKKGVTAETRTVADLSNAVKNQPAQRNGVLAIDPLPYGAILDNLGDYYSIQRDYPRVYRIGEGGLSAEATERETAEVRQFKGYLLFFERILTDYLAQLTRIRDLFSMLPDTERSATQQHTYFTGSLENVPNVDVLLSFAQSDVGKTALTTALAVYTEGALLEDTFKDLVKEFNQNKPFDKRINKREDVLLEIDFLEYFAQKWSNSLGNESKNIQSHLFDSIFQRDAVMDLLRQNLANAHFTPNVYEDAYGFFFTIQPTLGTAVLLGRAHYPTAKAAREAAALTALVGSFNTGFRLVNRPLDKVTDGKIYGFDIVSSPADNVGLLNQTLENSQQYAARRNGLLDHLLARFSEQFTDYALLMYQVFKGKTEDKTQTALDKARFLSNYDVSSQNRAKAFDYTEGGWPSDNTSGFEQRLKALSGIQDLRRRTLCPFVIDACEDEFLVKITDAVGNPLFETSDAIPKDNAAAVVRSFTEGAALKGNFDTFLKPTKGFGFAFKTPVVRLEHPVFYATEAERDAAVAAIHAIFRQNRAENEVFIASTLWQIELHDAKTAADLNVETVVGLQPDAGLKPASGSGSVDFVGTNVGEVKNLADVVRVGKTTFKTAAAALNATNNFTKSLETTAFALAADPQAASVFLNLAAFTPAVSTLPSVFRWHIFDGDNRKESGTTETPDEATALTDFINAKTVDGVTFCQNIRVFQAENGFLWSFMAGDAVLFNSLDAFLDREKALQSAFDTLILATDAKRYYKSGDEFNANFTFLLRGSDSRFVAKFPSFFATEKERDKALKNVQKLLKTVQNPLIIQAEPPRFVWHLLETASKSSDTEGSVPTVQDVASLDESVAKRDESVAKLDESVAKRDEKVATLKSFSHFDSQEHALADFNLTLHLVGKKEHYNVHENLQGHLHLSDVSNSKTTTYAFDILRDGAPCATSATVFEALGTCEKAVDTLIQHVSDNRYSVQTHEYPDRYKFQYFASETDATPLFISEKDYASVAEAEEGFAAFVKDLHTKTWADKGLHTHTGERAALMPEASERSLAFMDDVKKLRDTEGVTESAVQKSARSEQGRYVYRMLDKDAPLALAVNEKGDYWTFNQTEAAEKFKAFSQRTTQRYDVLTFCCHTENLLQIGNQWHYVLKVKRKSNAPVGLTPESGATLWASWTGYDTPQEAYTAFVENAYADVFAAMNGTNYDVLKPSKDASNGIFYDKNGRDTEGYPVGLHSVELQGKYRLFVPNTAAMAYDIKQLAASAQRYPLRETWGESLKTGDESFKIGNKSLDLQGKRRKKYHFALTNAKNGAVDWRSVETFETPETALAAWHQFDKMFTVAGATRLSMTSDCRYNIGLFELFLESEKRFFTEGEAWDGVDRLAAASKADVLYTHHKADSPNWTFSAADTCYRLATSPLLFSSVDECQAFLTKLATKNAKIALNEPNLALKRPYSQLILTQKSKDVTPVYCGCPPNLPFETDEDTAFLTLWADAKTCLNQSEIDVIQLSRNPKNYRVFQATERGAYTFELVDTTQILAIHKADYPMLSAASEVLKRADKCLNTEGVHLIEKILLRPRTPLDIARCAREVATDCCLPYLNEADICRDSANKTDDCYDCDPPTDVSPSFLLSSENDGDNQSENDCYSPEADAYSFVIQLVMPSWGKRFGDDNFVVKLTRLFAHEAPAHIWLDIERQNPRALDTFENKYRPWLCAFRSNLSYDPSFNYCSQNVDNQRLGNFESSPNVQTITPTVSPVSDVPSSTFFVENKEKSLENTPESLDIARSENFESSPNVRLNADNDRWMRRRLMQYSDNIQAVADTKLLKTESYKQTAFFLQNEGNLTALTLLVDLIMTKSLGKKGGATDAQYLTLLQNALGYALDKWVIASPNVVQQPDILRGIFEKMKVQNMGIEAFITAWKSEELAERLGATVVDSYKTLMIS